MTETNLRQLLLETIKTYFSSLNENAFDSISINIVSKFFENKLRANTSVLLKLVNVYKKIHMKESFELWSSQIQPITNNLLSNSNDSSHLNFNYPKPLYSSQLRNNNQISTISRRTNSLTQMENFLQRQEEYKRAKSQKKEQLIRNTEDEYNMMCTFTPNISLSKSIASEGNKSAFIRLYEDSNRRKVNYDKKVNAYIRNIKDESNFNNKKKKSIDKLKIEKLYNDYKKQKSKRQMLRQQIDSETGVTFKPRVNYSPFYTKRIIGNVNDRSKRAIEEKQNFITTFNYLREKEYIESRYKTNSNRKNIYKK